MKSKKVTTEQMGAKSLQLCPTLCAPMNLNPPGSSVHGILQARILEWVANFTFPYLLFSLPQPEASLRNLDIQENKTKNFFTV